MWASDAGGVSDHQLGLRAHVRDLPSYRVFVIFWGGLAAIDVCQAVDAPPAVQLAVVVALVAGCCRHAAVLTGIAVAGVAWLLVNGFVVNQLGTLHLDGFPDLLRAVLLLGVALTVTGVRR